MPVELIVTEAFVGRPEIENLSSLIEENLGQVDKPKYYFRRSASDELPQYLKIIADWGLYAPILAAAGIFLSTIAKHAANDTWEAIKSIHRMQGVRGLADLSEAMSQCLIVGGRNSFIVIGVSVPDKFWGTTITIGNPDPRIIAEKLCLFVENAELVARTARFICSEIPGPIGEIHVEFLSREEVELKWMNTDGSTKTLRIPSSYAERQ